jgi:hypothetical protein
MTPIDTIGVVTVHDGSPIESGEIIAPEVNRMRQTRSQLLSGPEDSWLWAVGGGNSCRP